jgi:hypothetical protein
MANAQTTTEAITKSPFPFWSVLGKSVLWSLAISIVGGLFAGALGVMEWGDSIPLLADLAQSNKVVGISCSLAIVATFLACVAFFEEAGVFVGFLILSFGGILVLGGCFWFGNHAFNFIRTAIAGGLLIPVIGFPVTFCVVAKRCD